jgi:hypothetical protein
VRKPKYASGVTRSRSRVNISSAQPEASVVLPIAATPSPSLPACLEGITEFPRGVLRHRRYQSSFDSNLVVVNVSHHTKPDDSKTRNFDLNAIQLNCRGDRSIYDGNMPLSHFPNMIVGAKIVINDACTTYDKGEIGTYVAIALRVYLQVCSWMIKGGTYQFKNLSKSQLIKLINDLSKHTWRGVLNYEELTSQLIDELESDPKLAEQFRPRGKTSTRGLNIIALETYLGVPMHSDYVEPRLRQAINSACGIEQKKELTYYEPIPTPSELKRTMDVLNCLSLISENVDSISFKPFPNPTKTRQELLKTPEPADQPVKTFHRRAIAAGQTPNITPTDYLKAFGIFVTYILTYGPALCELMEFARAAILSVRPSSFSSDTSSVRNAVADKADFLTQRGALPPQKIRSSRGLNGLVELVKLVMAAAAGLIAINHARRLNEIVGENKPYGLYFGCLEELSDFPPAYQIDIFVEKSYMAYASFPANTLTRDAVLLLERMFIIMRGTTEAIPQHQTPRSAGRSLKLFSYRSFTPGALDRARRSFDVRQYLVLLLIEAGIDPSPWDGQQLPFRRSFATLFTHRYDLREDPALQAHLGHLNGSSTIPYHTDKVIRPRGMSVEELHGRSVVESEQRAMMLALAEGGRDFLLHGVRRLLEGKFIGGSFTSLVLALIKRLSADIDFARLTEERKAGVIAEKLIARRFQPESMSHVKCMAGGAPHTKTGANCYRNGTLHRSEATRETCSGCVNGWSDDNNLADLIEEFERCAAKASDLSLDAATRSDFQKAADQLSVIIEKERDTTEANRKRLLEFKASWQIMIMKSRSAK